MRRIDDAAAATNALFGALFLSMLVPGASAQTIAETTSVSIDELDGPIRPLAGARSTTVRIDVTCSPASALPSGIAVLLAIDNSPPWANAVIAPERHDVDAQACASGAVHLESTLTIAVTDQAPAYQPDLLRLDIVTSPSGPGASSSQAAANVPIVAAYFGLLDASTPLAAIPGDHDELVLFPLTMTNFGNGATKIHFETGRVDDGLRVGAPPSIVLQSRQAGGVQTSHLVPVQAARMIEADDGTLSFTIRYHSSYALDAKLEGDSGELRFRVLPPGTKLDAGSVEQLNALPAPALPLATVAIALAAALLRRR